MLMKHLSERPRPLSQLRPDLPANLVHAIERALSKGRDERWESAEAFAAALSDDASVAPPPRPSTPRRSHPATVGTIPGRLDRSADPIERLREDTPLPGPPLPQLPRDWMFSPSTREHGKEALRQWRDEQRRWKAEVRGRPSMVRRRIGGGVVTIAMLAVINAVFTPGFPWVLFPAIGIGFGVVKSLSSLWADGIPPRASSEAEAVLDSVPRDVLEGPHGDAVRDAYAARAQIRSVLGHLRDAEKAMLPEILPTVELLVERVRTLSGALHALDADASPDALVRLRRRIAEAEAMPEETPERQRRLDLLERQFATLTDLAERRSTLAEQREHALLVLDSMKLDLLKLRSSGLAARLDDQGQVTQEMRALARDVQRAAEAVDETRREF